MVEINKKMVTNLVVTLATEICKIMHWSFLSLDGMVWRGMV